MRYCYSPSHGRGARRWIQITHTCVISPLCSVRAITHYIGRKGTRKACIRCLKRACRPFFSLFCRDMHAGSGCIEGWEDVGEKRVTRHASHHPDRGFSFCCCWYPRFKDSCTSFSEGCLLRIRKTDYRDKLVCENEY